MKPTKEKPLITVKVINRKLLEQIYDTRGEMDGRPDAAGVDEVVVGRICGVGSILVHNPKSGNVRLIWAANFLAANCLGSPATQEAERREFLERMPQIFVG